MPQDATTSWFKVATVANSSCEMLPSLFILLNQSLSENSRKQFPRLFAIFTHDNVHDVFSMLFNGFWLFSTHFTFSNVFQMCVICLHVFHFLTCLQRLSTFVKCLAQWLFIVAVDLWFFTLVFQHTGSHGVMTTLYGVSAGFQKMDFKSQSFVNRPTEIPYHQIHV